MSMLSAQIDELRNAAEFYDGFKAANLMRDAADTIWQLRDDLQRANAENAKLRERGAKTLEVGTRWMAKAARLESENTKLRELCRRYGEYISQDRCEGCVYKMRCNNGFIDECWQRSEIRDLARELGVEEE